MKIETSQTYRNMSFESSVARSGLNENNFKLIQETAYRQLFDVKPYQSSHIFTNVRYFTDKDTGRL